MADVTKVGSMIQVTTARGAASVAAHAITHATTSGDMVNGTYVTVYGGKDRLAHIGTNDLAEAQEIVLAITAALDE